MASATADGYAAPRMTEPSLPAWQNPAFAAVHCFACETPHDRHAPLTVCRACGLPLRVDYDHARAPVAPAPLAGRPASLWRYREVLPILPEHAVSLVEGWTPLCPASDRLFVKDESRNPTGSFKARGLGMAITKARTLGARGFIIPSAGNAGGAAALYAARCGLPCAVIVPRGTPPAAIAEAAIGGASVFTIEAVKERDSVNPRS
jgi:threonine synthase